MVTEILEKLKRRELIITECYKNMLWVSFQSWWCWWIFEVHLGDSSSLLDRRK